jgi:hypothetical protein
MHKWEQRALDLYKAHANTGPNARRSYNGAVKKLLPTLDRDQLLWLASIGILKEGYRLCTVEQGRESSKQARADRRAREKRFKAGTETEKDRNIREMTALLNGDVEVRP